MIGLHDDRKALGTVPGELRYSVKLAITTETVRSVWIDQST